MEEKWLATDILRKKICNGIVSIKLISSMKDIHGLLWLWNEIEMSYDQELEINTL